MKSVLRFIVGVVIILVLVAIVFSLAFLLGWLLTFEPIAWLFVIGCAVVAAYTLSIAAYQLGKSFF